MATTLKEVKPNLKNNPDPTDEYEDLDDSLEDTLYARHSEIETFADLEKQRGTTIPALFNQLYKFVQNPSSVSVETFKRMVDTDDTIGSGFDFLTSCLAARMGRYTHKNKEITEHVNWALDNIEGGFTSLVKALFSASWAGFAVGELVWSNTARGFVPQKVVILPPTTVLFETERTGELCPDGILQYQRNYNPFLQGLGFNFGGGVGFGVNGFDMSRPDPFAKFGDLPFPMRTANSFNYLSIRIPRQKCIHYAFDAQGQFGNPYGRSLARRIYKYYVMKDAILQMKMIALDRKGTPLNVVFCDPNAMLEDPAQDDGQGSQGYRNQPKKGLSAAKAAAHAFKNVHNDSTIFLPGKEDEMFSIKTIPQASNVADFIAAEDFCNKSILRGLLLPSLIFGNGDGTGSFSLGQEHAKTFDKICDSIIASFEHVLLQQLVKPIIAYNFPKEAWEKEGLGAFSKKTLSREEIEKEAALYTAGIADGIIDQANLNDLNKMRDTLGFEPVEKVIEKPNMLMPGMPGEEGDPEADPNLDSKDPKNAPAKTEEKPAEAEKKKNMFKKFVESFARLLGVKQ